MAAKIIVIGAAELGADLEEMRRLIKEEPELITEQLERSMQKFVHVVTGYLWSTIYHKGRVAGADAPYAGIEEERGESHAYATRAIEDFDMDQYADRIVEPF